MIIQWSTDGVAWNNGSTYHRYRAIKGWTQQTYTLPAGAVNQPNLKIAFLFTSEYGYNCYLDDLRIESKTTSSNNEIQVLEMLVYPNPSKGLFKVVSDKLKGDYTIDVRDINGKLIYSKKHKVSEETIDLSGQAAGIYFIQVKTGENIFKQKMVIE